LLDEEEKDIDVNDDLQMGVAGTLLRAFV